MDVNLVRREANEEPLVSEKENGQAVVDVVFCAGFPLIGGVAGEPPLEVAEEGVGGTLEVENVSDLSKKMYLTKRSVDRPMAIT